MRIATLGNAAVIHTQRWVEYFRARGHEVQVWSLEPGPPALGAHRLPALSLPGALRYPLAAPAVRSAFRAFAPDVVDAHFVPNYGVIGRLAGWRPLVVTAWGSDLLVLGRANPLQAARARWVLSGADAVIADAENLAAAARSLGGDGRVHAIPWGVDLDRFRARVVREPALMLSTRMHEPVYDLPTVLRGARRVLESRPDARLVVAGEGSLTGELRALAARELPGSRVEFVGRLTPDAMAEWLGRAAVAISASRSDSTSMSLLESMAAGAIPVVTDLDGNREWVADGGGARLFAAGDADGLARGVLDVLADPARAERFRARNRAEVERRADHVANMARIERLFESLRSDSGRRA
jgi:glycosyltransferase involved in cell wall biosynthesis